MCKTNLDNLIHNNAGLLIPSNILDQEAIFNNPLNNKLYDILCKEIDNQYSSMYKKNLRKKLMYNKIKTDSITRFIRNRIFIKEAICKGVNKWKKINIAPINADQFWYYDNCKGWRRFKYTQSSYNFYIKYHKDPYIIT